MGVVFLSFLGTSRYDPVAYSMGGHVFPPTPYIQEVIARAHRESFESDGSAVKVFMTDEARKANWEIPEGLKSRLYSFLSPEKVQGIGIEAPSGESGLWKLFEILQAEIEPDSEIILDVTHGFRTIPLIGTVLTGYTRSLKRTKVSAIYYATNDSDRKGCSEVVDLTQLERLMRWSGAVEAFLRRGDALDMERLASETVHSLLNRGDRAESQKLERALASNLKDIYSVLTTVRGNEIVSGEVFLKAQINLDKLSGITRSVTPMAPLFRTIQDRLAGFQKNSPANLLLAVDLCIQYGLVQQGLTLLQESMVTILLAMEGLKDFNSKNFRRAVYRSFSFLGTVSTDGKDYDDPRQDIELAKVAESIMVNTLTQRLTPAYSDLSQKRNNINHASFNRDTFNTNIFLKTLTRCFSEVLYYILEYDRPLGDARYKKTARMMADTYPFCPKSDEGTD